jgi:hypothetical protein
MMDADIPSIIKDGKKERVLFCLTWSCRSVGHAGEQETASHRRETVRETRCTFPGYVVSFGRHERSQQKATKRQSEGSAISGDE